MTTSSNRLVVDDHTAFPMPHLDMLHLPARQPQSVPGSATGRSVDGAIDADVVETSYALMGGTRTISNSQGTLADRCIAKPPPRTDIGMHPFAIFWTRTLDLAPLRPLVW